MSEKITGKTTIAELGAIVCEALKAEGIDAFLSGGAVVSIYTDNRYESYDLDFVSIGDQKKIARVMESLGFTRDRGRPFLHPKTKFSVEFPGAAARVGESLITKFKNLELSTGTLKLLTPTDCVKDRLAAFYHWNDRQGLDQAVWVALAHPVKLAEIKKWSDFEGKPDGFLTFEAELKKAKKAQ